MTILELDETIGSLMDARVRVLKFEERPYMMIIFCHSEKREGIIKAVQKLMGSTLIQRELYSTLPPEMKTKHSMIRNDILMVAIKKHEKTLVGLGNYHLGSELAVSTIINEGMDTSNTQNIDSALKKCISVLKQFRPVGVPNWTPAEKKLSGGKSRSTGSPYVNEILKSI